MKAMTNCLLSAIVLAWIPVGIMVFRLFIWTIQLTHTSSPPPGDQAMFFVLLWPITLFLTAIVAFGQVMSSMGSMIAGY